MIDYLVAIINVFINYLFMSELMALGILPGQELNTSQAACTLGTWDARSCPSGPEVAVL